MKRRRTTSKPKRRKRADWVYRGITMDEEGTPISFVHPTYHEEFLSMPANSSAVMWLYDSKNAMVQLSGGTPGPGTFSLPQSARAEGKRAQCLGVDLKVYMRVTNWVANARIRCGMRIGIIEQDPSDGDGILPANYSMFVSLGVQHQVAMWANQQRVNMWERRFFQENVGTDSTAGFMLVRAWVPLRRCYLAANEGLGLYFENDNFGSTVLLQRWCRTLVVDED